jgi:DNA-directed RNA polymerase specialized sigma24 family protein
MHGISNSDHPITREALFISLYKKAFPVVAKYISRMGGSIDEAKDVFHDALIIYYEKAISASSPPENEIAYLFGTAKHLWLKKYRQNSKHTSLDHFDLLPDPDENRPSNQRLMHFLKTAGKKCMDLLTGFYYNNLPLTDIASQFGYSGVRSATVQKYKCLEKVRETIKEKALTYDDFVE